MSKLRQQKKRGAPISFKDLSNPWQRFRSQCGMSQADLAAQLQVGQVTICQYETGIRAPRMRIAKAFVELAKRRRIRMSLQEIYSNTGENHDGNDTDLRG